MPAAFTCDLTAIAPAEREGHQELIRRLVSETIGDSMELPDGLALRLPADAYDAVLRFVACERLCGPCRTFTLDIRPPRGPFGLRLTSPARTTQSLPAPR